MQEQLNRRTAILAIGGATAVAAVPVAAIASSPSVDRSAWARALAAYEQAKADDEAYNSVYEALSDQCQQEEQAIPHVVFRPDPDTGHQQPITTADQLYVRRAKRLVNDVKAGKIRLETVQYPSLNEHWQLSQEVAAAAEKREAKVAAVRARFGMEQAEEKWEALGHPPTTRSGRSSTRRRRTLPPLCGSWSIYSTRARTMVSLPGARKPLLSP